jgi:hypothetical protein
VAGTLLSALIIVAALVTTSTPLPPNARPDAYTVGKNQLIKMQVLANDDDPKGSNLTIAGVMNPLYGSVQISVDKVLLLYRSAPRFAGLDTFNYTVSNGWMTAMGQVTVTVYNEAPEPVDLEYTVAKNKEFRAELFQGANAGGRRIVDVDGDPMVISSPLDLNNTVGAASISDDGLTVVYEPLWGWQGDDSVGYRVFDGNDTSVPARVTFRVVNTPPKAGNVYFRNQPKDQVLSLDGTVPARSVFNFFLPC